MKKTNILLVLILLINAAILWSVCCCKSSCNDKAACTSNVECSYADGSTGDSTCTKSAASCKKNKKGCCKKGNDAKACAGSGCCKKGKCTKAYAGSGSCKKGSSSCAHGKRKGKGERADHDAHKMKWMKEELGLSDEQMEQVKANMAEGKEKMEAMKARMKAWKDSQHEALMATLTDEQKKMMEEKMAEHGHKEYDTETEDVVSEEEEATSEDTE